MNYFIKIKTKLIKENILPEKFTDKNKDKYNFQWIINAPSQKVLDLRNSNEIIKNMFNFRTISMKEHKYFLDNYRLF